MLIVQTRILNLSRYFGGLIPRTDFRLVVKVSDVVARKLDASGFAGLGDGDVLLPANVGTVSRRNAEGDYIIHKDQPKETRSIGVRTWTRKQWAGRGQVTEVTESVNVERECYPRTFVPPPGVELTVVDYNGDLFIVSDTMTTAVTPDEDVLHVTNLFLELFGRTEIRHANLNQFTPPQTRRLNWSLLPPGTTTAAGVLAHLRPYIARRARTYRDPIMERLNFMASRNPDEVYLGHGGFGAYVAYVFNTPGNAVLESVLPDNATYVFGSNWATVSRMTKTDVLNGRRHIDRIFHRLDWQRRVTPYTI
ncbi:MULTISPECIES: hypothetical protein [Brevundimonas]|jgi:hypothetical protein|uniref:hypothetical protein n=1 Tax=Brevundimonas TaxID=41275 RepID=UPI0019035EB7|nr:MULTISPECIES: hypothetical protein [Brevundimonas]MBK1968872.1 hypothetical protein [Brevundimonas diminuta]MDA0743765.1 hypothetical protein [Pseudomonadota bacterium]MDA1322489.1 hypothetical protein [Pseudomonadota bacterium]MDM8351749.1 hypothetical protein [Brevundimonas diminuta]